MKSLSLTISDVQFNPAFEGFEATAIFKTPSALVKVPAFFKAPVQSDFDWVSAGLNRAAMNAILDRSLPKSIQVLDDLEGANLALAA